MNQEAHTDISEPGGRSPAEIEADIARTRADMDETLDALQHRLSPEMITAQARSYLAEQTEGGRELVENFIEAVRRNPLPMALLGLSVGWLMLSGRRGSRMPRQEMIRRPERLPAQSPAPAQPVTRSPRVNLIDSAAEDAKRDVRESVHAAAQDVAAREQLNVGTRGRPAGPGTSH